ncbi:MAG: CopG family transcriptional regulator [Opitutaceae bacterium]
MSKATLYLDEPVHKALRLKAAETRQSMSELVNDALKASLLEDLEDIADWRERKDDDTIGFEDFVAQLKEDGIL